MNRDLLDEIKNKWNIPVTLPMSVPWGKDDVVWLVQEVERLRADLAKAQEKAAIYEKDWREAKSEFGTATSKLREQLRTSQESATRGWEAADSFHITVSGLGAENDRLRGQIDSLIEAADAARLLLLFTAGPHEAGAVPAMLLEAIEKAKGETK